MFVLGPSLSSFKGIHRLSLCHIKQLMELSEYLIDYFLIDVLEATNQSKRTSIIFQWSIVFPEVIYLKKCSLNLCAIISSYFPEFGGSFLGNIEF